MCVGLIVIDLKLVVIVQEGIRVAARCRGLSLQYRPWVVPGRGGLWRCGKWSCDCRGGGGGRRG